MRYVAGMSIGYWLIQSSQVRETYWNSIRSSDTDPNERDNAITIHIQ